MTRYAVVYEKTDNNYAADDHRAPVLACPSPMITACAMNGEVARAISIGVGITPARHGLPIS